MINILAKTGIRRGPAIFTGLSFAAALIVAPTVTVAQGQAAGGKAIPADAPALAPNWCELDAPGIWRKLRRDARAAGKREIGSCPEFQMSEGLPERITIPLPCGRALDFVRVDIPVAGVLDHILARFGGAPEDASIITRFAQGRFEASLAGAFSRSRAGNTPGAERNERAMTGGYSELVARSYYIATHEWTELQQLLVDSGALALWGNGGPRPDRNEVNATCAQVAAIASEKRFSTVRPAVNLSWYDVQAMLGQLNAYVIHEGNRRIAEGGMPLVPWEQGSTGFIRLPTEIEWEYAAWGGAVGFANGGALPPVRASDGSLREPVLKEIAALADHRGGKILPAVGTSKPNLLGIFDMVGGASEMTHDLFFLVRPDRPQGTSGGIVLRGGNALTPETLLSPAHREELPFFTAEGVGKTAFSGARLAISAPVLARGYDPSGNRAPDFPNSDLEKALELESESLTSIQQTPGAAFRDEARKLLNGLQLNIESVDPAIAAQITAVSRALEQSEAAINSARKARIVAEVRSVADAIFAMRSLSALAITWHERLDEAEKIAAQFSGQARSEAEAQVARARARVYRRMSLIDVQVREIERRLLDLVDADPELVRFAIDKASSILRGTGIDLYDKWVWPRLELSLERMRRAPGEDHFVWLRDQLDAFREQRLEKWPPPESE